MQNSPEECPDCRFLVVGTRSDLRSIHVEVNEDMVANWAKQHNVGHLLCSSKTGSGIDVVMTHITRLALSPTAAGSRLLSGGTTAAGADLGAASNMRGSPGTRVPMYKIAVLGGTRSGKTSFLAKLSIYINI